MRIAVLFDGAGLARLGLEQAGHECHGFEIDPWKHALSTLVGSGNCTLTDVRNVDLRPFDAIWSSPPCSFIVSQERKALLLVSMRKTCWNGLSLDAEVLWVENVISPSTEGLGTRYNAAQFLEVPIQNRNRIVGGRYRSPRVFHSYKRAFPGICPCITASEHAGCASHTRRASRFYGRRITPNEAAYHQGFSIPDSWWDIPETWKGTPTQWRNNIYEAIGNGVPVYMAKAFGEAYDH